VSRLLKRRSSPDHFRLNLEGSRAEFLSIVGPSARSRPRWAARGLAAFSADSGEVLSLGRVMTGPPENVVIVFRIMQRIAAMADGPGDNVAFSARIAKACRRRMRRSGNDARSLFGLLERADDYPAIVGGMPHAACNRPALALRPSVMRMTNRFAVPGRHDQGGLQDECFALRDRTRRSFVFSPTISNRRSTSVGDRVGRCSRHVPAVSTSDLPRTSHPRAIRCVTRGVCRSF